MREGRIALARPGLRTAPVLPDRDGAVPPAAATHAIWKAGKAGETVYAITFRSKRRRKTDEDRSRRRSSTASIRKVLRDEVTLRFTARGANATVFLDCVEVAAGDVTDSAWTP